LGEGENLPARMTYAPHEQEGVHMQKSRLAKRARIGADWDGKAANDNIAWPLATALVREGNTELLKAAMYYRKVHDTAKSEAKLGGSSVSIGDGVALDRYSYVRPNGSVVYARPRQKKSADVDIPAKRYTSPPSYDTVDHSSEEVKVSNWSNVPKPWNGDAPVNNMIDAQRRLGELRSRLGYLCEPFELACIDGRTLEEVGNAMGTANRSGATAAGRAIVHMALITLRDAIGDVKRSDLTHAPIG
jgi:hypothetical protein